MYILKRIWDDVRHGKNIDLYVTVSASIVLTLLSLLGRVSETKITSITLSVLALIAISLLVNRYKVEELLNNSRTNDIVFFDEFPESMISEIENANELWLSGVTLSSIFLLHFSTLEHMAAKGRKIKALLVQPNGSAVENAASRAYVPSALNVERVADDILRTLENLCHLKKISPLPNNIEIRTINHPMERRIIGINPHTATGVLYIANYSFRTPSGAKPKFVLQARDGKWYDFYVEEFELLWANGKKWGCKGSR